MRILAYIIILASKIFASSHGREIPNFLEIVACHSGYGKSYSTLFFSLLKKKRNLYFTAYVSAMIKNFVVAKAILPLK